MAAVEAKFEVEPDEGDGGGFHWHLLGANSEIVCVSESFTREDDAWRAAERMPEIALEAWGNLPQK